jgi:hypothetical protein
MTQSTQSQPAVSDHDRPALSIVITIVSGASHLERCLAALAGQVGCDPAQQEVIVPHDERDMDIPGLQANYPAVRFEPVALSIEAPTGLCHEHFDELRAAGLRLARGRIMALLEDHEIPAPDWCKQMLAAHENSYAAVGGAVENDIQRPVNQATCLFDFGRYQLPLSPGLSRYLTDVNVGYKREAFNGIRHVWEQRFHEPLVHQALLDQGERLWLTPDLIVYQHRQGLTLARAIRERFIWGRYFAGKRIEKSGLPARAVYCILSVTVPAIILVKMFRIVLAKQRLVGVFLKVLPVTLLLVLSWSMGEFTGYLTGRPSRFTQRM